MKHPPLISIITVTFNAEKYLERTIQSIIRQTYPTIEYLIIDGNSSDKTISIIQQYEEHITKWISESDKGIYDAMNKGLHMAAGEYVWFMNAGDEIYESTTLEKIILSHPISDIYYGETLFLDLRGKHLGTRSEATPLKLPSKLHWKQLQMGLLVCHQAILVRRDIAPFYALNHAYSADIDWVIQSLKKAQSITNVSQIIAIYLQGGFSRKHLVNSLLDRFYILQKHYGFFRTCWNHLRIIGRSIRYILKKGKGY